MIESSAGDLPPRATSAVVGIAAGALLLHLACLTDYGIFRDELYYVACGEHLAWGYVDHPPLVAVLARAVRALFGESLAALRVFPAVLFATTVLLTAALARRLGGGRFGQTLAALAFAVAPHFLGVSHFFSMNAPEVFLWTLGAILVVRAIAERAGWAWIAFGVVAGLGLLDKISMGVFGLGIALGLIATRAREALRTPWPWIAAVIAAAMFLPHVLWQVRHGWPTREFVENAQRYKIAELSPLEFLREVALLMHPLTLPIWLIGLWACFRGSSAKRVLGCAFVVVFAVFLIQRSKAYYVTPAFPMVFAAGAVAIERWSDRRRVVRGAITAVLAVTGLFLAPFALPLLSVERFVAYQDALGLRPHPGERHEMGGLPQHFADMFGWEELARAVSAVYLALPESERASARVWAGNYGEAGAIDFFRSKYPLPSVLCPHNNYWFWGPGADGGTLIVIGGEREEHLDSFETVELAGESDSRYAMPYERHLALWVCRGWTVSLNAVWEDERNFN